MIAIWNSGALGTANTSAPLEEGWYPCIIESAVDEPGKDGKNDSCKLTYGFYTVVNGKQTIVQRTDWLAYDQGKAPIHDFKKKIINNHLLFVCNYTKEQITQPGFQYDPTTWKGRQFYCYYRPAPEKKTPDDKVYSTILPISMDEYQRNTSAAAAAPAAAAPAAAAPAPMAPAPMAAAPGFPAAPSGFPPVNAGAPGAPAGFGFPPPR